MMNAGSLSVQPTGAITRKSFKLSVLALLAA